MSRKNALFFQNRKCEWFPCHETACPDTFNCLFCYCPLYTLGDSCGGNFCYTEDGVKDCSACLTPHTPDGYERVLSRFPELTKLAGRKSE